METHSQSQPRPRKRQRPRVSESASTSVPAAVPPQAWGSGVAAHPAAAVRATAGDTVNVPPTSGFPSQQLERSHQVAEPDSLMNGYNAPQQHQYSDTQSSLAPASQNDPSGLGNLNNSLSNIAGDTSTASQHHSHTHQHHLHTPQAQQSQQQQQQRQSAATTNKTDRVIFSQYNAPQSTGDSPPATVASSAPAASYSIPVWPSAGPATPSSSMPPQSPAPKLAPPPEGIYRSFDDLLNAVQKVAKDQGYGIVKLRASNYRDGKPTRYDLVCDRGGVKYNSTAKKRNPSTRKIDCPWRAKAVCEVNLGNQWRFAVQESRHNHEPRMPAAAPGQENTPIAQTMRSIMNKLDRMSHEMGSSFDQIHSRLDGIEKRLESLEGRSQLLGANGVPTMAPSSIPTANMGGATLGNGPLTNGGIGASSMMDSRMSSMEARVSAMEPRGNGMDTLPMMDDDTGRLAMMVNS